jgi:two-component system NtrC family response regulator
VARSPEMQAVVALARRVAPTNATVLLLGETGTGKNLLARAIHHESPRRAGPYVSVDCAALPETLLESELFGHEKDAFTDAGARKVGRFELANGGTIFLDEVAELGLGVQAKLLRVLQERSFERVGGTETIHLDVRIIAATNRNLEEALKQNRLREDLYFRLNVVPIRVPALRERRKDIPHMARAFVSRLSSQHQRPLEGLSDEALDLLERYPWPGNVRELEHAVERAVLVADGPSLRPEHFALDFVGPASTAPEDALLTLEELEREYIRRVLWRMRGHKGRAARVLGINRKTLLEKRKRYGLS